MREGDRVRTRGGLVGVVAVVRVPLLPDCALVRFNPMSDGICYPRSSLTVVEKEETGEAQS